MVSDKVFYVNGVFSNLISIFPVSSLEIQVFETLESMTEEDRPSPSRCGDVPNLIQHKFRLSDQLSPADSCPVLHCRRESRSAFHQLTVTIILL